MKKLFFLMIAAVAMTFVACTSEENNEASASDAASTSVAVTEFNADNFAAQLDSLLAANDTVGAKALLEQASKKIEDLKAQGGNEDELAKLIATVKSAVDSKAEALKGLGLTELATKVAEVPENLKEKVDGAVKDLATEAKDAAVDKANEVKDAAVEKANEVKEAATQKVEEAKDAANKKVEEAKQAAGKTIDNAADAAKKKIGL